jgi:hypothetical protein
MLYINYTAIREVEEEFPSLIFNIDKVVNQKIHRSVDFGSGKDTSQS